MMRGRHAAVVAGRTSGTAVGMFVLAWREHGVPALCLAVFLTGWTALAIAPYYRTDWALENLPTLIGVPIAIVGYRRFRFSDRAYLQAAGLLLLHTIGSHYTYSEVPLGGWMRDLAGLGRNHYDRLVHFAFGLLMLRPIVELGFRSTRPGPVARVYFGVAGVAFWSLLYEVAEWLVASIVDPAAGAAYLGTQGDPWDAEKDMALALCGAVIAAAVDSWIPVGTPAASRASVRHASR